MIKRPRQIDYFRTVTRINVWEEFNSFDNEGQQGNNAQALNQSTSAQVATLNGDKNEKENIPIIKKQEIPIIAASNIKVQNQSSSNQQVAEELYKKRRIHTSNYIRIRQDQIWPLQEKYELADDDVIYLKDFNEAHNFNMKEEELEFLIENFEMKSGKDFIINWIDMKDYISNEIRDKYTFTNLEKIYNYWKVKRDLLKRPLLRLHWKPNYNDKDPHVAFRPRVAEKMKLRRSMKQNDDEQLTKLSALKEEMSKYKLLVQQIKLREQMKEWILESQSIAFVSELYKVDKQLQYFFVDDVFENHKDLELKKQKMDEKGTNLHQQNNLLNDQLSAFDLNPAVHKPKQFIRPTGQSHIAKEQKPNQEVIKTENIQNNANSNPAQPASNSAILTNVLLNREFKKTGKSNKAEEVPVLQPEIDLKENKKKKDRKKGDLNQSVVESSGKLNISIPKESKEQHQKQSSLTSQSSATNKITEITIPPLNQSTKNLDKESQPQEKGKIPSKKGEKTGDISLVKVSTKLGPAEPPTSQGTDHIKLLNQDRDADIQKSAGEKDSVNPAIANLSLFNTDNFEFAAFVASIFIEASKRELTLDKVCNPDTKNIGSDQISHILNSQTELANQLKKLHKGSNGPSIIKNPPPNHEYPQIPHHQMNMPQYIHPQGAGNHPNMYDGRGMQYDRNTYNNRIDQMNPIPMQNPPEISHAKKKNVIPFKPRLRIGRSGLVNIDRQFDDKDNLRYEDICSKEANYHPNKIVDKMLAQQLMKERAEQQKLKVYSFTPTDTELFKKDYFQQRQLKFKQLADDDETQMLYPQASSTNIQPPNNVLQPISSSQGLSQQQLNGASTPITTIPNLESSQMIIEDSMNSMLSSTMSQQQLLNNDQDIKLLRKSISIALKNYQKSKQQNSLKI